MIEEKYKSSVKFSDGCKEMLAAVRFYDRMKKNHSVLHIRQIATYFKWKLILHKTIDKFEQMFYYD